MDQTTWNLPRICPQIMETRKKNKEKHDKQTSQTNLAVELLT